VMGVDPEFAGRGVGRALAEEMLRRYAARGVRKVRTMVDSSMPEVEAFFTRLGFAADTLRSYRMDLDMSPVPGRD